MLGLATLVATLVADVPRAAAILTIAEYAAPVTSSTGGNRRGRDLFRVTLDLATHANAVCNDGTPGVFYVRRASDPASENKWVIYLQGGFFCTDYETCLARWTNNGSPYGAHKMSTDLNGAPAGAVAWSAPPDLNAGGILSRGIDNSFAGWNLVYLYHCSSDQWTGRRSDSRLKEPGVGRYTIHFRGATILDAVIDDLQGGAVDYDSDRDGVADATLPDLDDATLVIFAGSSAGGGGVQYNADRLKTDLLATNADLDFRALVDAAGNPDTSALTWPLETTYEGFYRALWRQEKKAWRIRNDVSCQTDQAMNGDLWRCADNTLVLLEHLDTSFFHRQDLQDPVQDDLFVPDLGTLEDYADGIEAQLVGLTANPRGLSPAPQVFGPVCGTHVAIDSNDGFLYQRIGSDTGPNYHDTLVDWLAGTYTAGTIDTYQSPFPAHCVCPP
jgi:hypothetical protein